ncbi:MAG TPA: thiamine-phosphate kinase [Polyangiaceae bacterium]|jgi:thiamine-monophosphate kinase
MDERARIARLAELLAASHPDVERGIGDDAAVLAAPGAGKLVWTIDEQVEGVHFRREWLSWEDVGWRSFVAAASDVAAMGAMPWCALSAIALPTDVDDAAFEAIVRGQRDAAKGIDAPVVGGNLSRGPVVSITTTVLGRAPRAVGRDGARPGQRVLLAGRVGFAAAGLRALERGLHDDPRLVEAVAAWRRPSPLGREGVALGAAAHAAVDVSDGLACDLGHVADASRVAVVLEEDLLLGQPGLRVAAGALGVSEIDLVLQGGEDYALVATSDVTAPGFRTVGTVRSGKGIFLRAASGEHAVDPRGFDHFMPRGR